MRSLFESLFTTKDIVRAKYPNGWVGWLNDKMSDDDDGRLTRFTTMDMARIIVNTFFTVEETSLLSS